MLKKKKSPKLTRKQLRKEQRKQKKVRRNEYYTNRKKPGQFVLNPDRGKKPQPLTENVTQAKRGDKVANKTVSAEELRKKELEQQKKLQRKMDKQRKKQLMQANLQEDRTIKQLEKQLKLNKRKTKGVPKSFTLDGLDYLLEVCDPETMKGAASVEQQLSEVNDQFEEDLAAMTGDKDEDGIFEENKDHSENESEGLSENESEGHSENESEGHSENESEGHSENESEGHSENGSEGHSENESEDHSEGYKKRKIPMNEQMPPKKFKNNSDAEDAKISEENETWEDIYGRERTKSGAVLNKYIPPALRDNPENLPQDKKRMEKLNRLRRQLKGLFNRLAESNMHAISQQIEELYMKNSRNDMNDTITNLIFDSLIAPVLTPERLLMEHIMLITILHANIGSEIGAHVLQKIVKKFDEIFKSSSVQIEDKTLENAIGVIAQMYNFKIFDCKLVFEILEKLSAKFSEKFIDCILLVLRAVGFNLRKDDPLGLKSLILNLQKEAAGASHELKDNARVKFMLDILLAIKNNNVSKIPNYDTTYSEHLKKILKGFIRKGNYVTQLNISLEDLLKADERGRWWVVGSAWTGNIKQPQETDSTKTENTFSKKLLELARKQRMNTDTRRNIFCIIMSAEDYLDAYEKLSHLGLKNQQAREIIHVILHCCLQENTYNPYYAILAQKFCDDDRKYKLTVKYSIWDKLKVLNDYSAHQISNLAKLLIHLFVEQSLPVSTLKIVQFSDMDKVTLRFIRQILLGILLHDDPVVIQTVFEKVALSDKLKMFRQSLRLFIHHFLLRNLRSDAVSQQHKDLLENRAKLVEKLLTVKDRTS